MLTSSSGLRVARCALALFAASLFCTRVEAGLIFHGESVSFEGVTESSVTHETPLFGKPTLSVNTLDFHPNGFGVSAENEASDRMDVQLSTTITAKPGHWITRVQLREDGDFSLGAWKTDSDAMVRAILVPTIHIFVEGNRVDPVAPDDVSYGIGPVAGGLPPTTLSDGSFWLSQFTTNILDPVDLRWAAELDFDVESHLADRGISGKATSVYLTFDNRLRALALEGADAMIIKKMASITATAVPEPGVPMLLGMAMMALLGVRRRPRRA